MIKILRKINFGIWMYAYIFLMWPYFSKVNKLREQGDIPGEIDAIRELQHEWGKGVLKKFGVKIHVYGLENIPEGPVLFVSNHQSYADIPIFVAAIDRQIGFVAKAELGRLPVFGKRIAEVRSVFIERNDARASLRAIQKGVELLQQGFSLGIFPEGKRSRGPEMLEFKRGSLKLATKAGVPIVPVVISGSYNSFEKNGYPEATDVSFTILPSIDTGSLKKEEASNLTEKLEEIIRAELLK